MIKSASRSSITSNEKYRSMSVGNVPSSEFLIQTALITSNTSQVVFDVTGLGTQFRHLRLVTVAKGTAGLDGYNVQFNGDAGANYAAHVLFGNGSQVLGAAASSTTFFSIGLAAPGSEANVFSASDCDILDPFSPNKNTTARVLVAARGLVDPFVQLRSGAWFNTTPLTSIRIYPNSGLFTDGSRFSLYGVTA